MRAVQVCGRHAHIPAQPGSRLEGIRGHICKMWHASWRFYAAERSNSNQTATDAVCPCIRSRAVRFSMHEPCDYRGVQLSSGAQRIRADAVVFCGCSSTQRMQGLGVANAVTRIRSDNPPPIPVHDVCSSPLALNQRSSIRHRPQAAAAQSQSHTMPSSSNARPGDQFFDTIQSPVRAEPERRGVQQPAGRLGRGQEVNFPHRCTAIC